MNQEILDTVLQCVILPIIPLVGVLLSMLIKKGIDYLQSKIDNDDVDRYLEDAEKALVRAIKSTSQTYVSTLKGQQGGLTPEQQQIAFEKSKEAFEKSIGEDGKMLLENLLVDYNQWIEDSIEALVGDNHIDAPKKVSGGIIELKSQEKQSSIAKYRE